MQESAKGADDLEILFPTDKTITIKGEPVTFNEYGFYAGLKVRAVGQAFIDDMSALFNQPHKISLSQTDALLGKHADVVVSLIALACNKTEAWVQGLSETEGCQVYDAWWEINGPFFVRCAAQNLRSDRMVKLLGGLMFGPSSLPTATTQSASEITPTDK